MNGHDEDAMERAYAYSLANQPDDDDGGPQRTDIPCPYCGHNVEWTGARLVCDTCEVFWHDAAQVETERESVKAGYR